MSDGILRATPKPKKSRRAKPAGLKRGRIRARGKRSKRSGGNLFPKSVRPEYRDFVRYHRCVVYSRFTPRDWIKNDPRPIVWHKCVGAIQACHVKSRGAGGADFANLYPGCAAAHHEQHAIGIPAFEKRWGVDLRKIAEQLYHDFLKSGGSGDPNP